MRNLTRREILRCLTGRSNQEAMPPQDAVAQIEAFPGLGVVESPPFTDEAAYRASIEEEVARLGMTLADLEEDA